MAQENFHQYVAIDLDGLVESAPLIQPNQASFTSFQGKGEISGSFTQATAKNLALAAQLRLAAGASSTSSPRRRCRRPWASRRSRPGCWPASAGCILVLLYTILYYRVLGIVVVAGLLTTAALLWAIVSALGHRR